MVASGMDSLIFINDVPHDGSSKINSVYRNILSVNLQIIGWSFIMLQDSDSARTANTLKVTLGKVEGFRPNQSPDHNPI